MKLDRFMASESGHVTIDGGKIHYSVEGSGLPCIVISSSVYHSRTFSIDLRKHLKLVFMDARLFAPTSSLIPVEEVTMDTMVDDIEHIRRALGFKKVVVMGHSVFALVVHEYARKYPEHVSHVVMIGMTPGWNKDVWDVSKRHWETDASEERKRILEVNRSKLTEEVLYEASPSERIMMNYVANGPRYWYDPNYDCSWIWEGVEINSEVWDHFVGKVIPEYIIHPEDVYAPVFLAVGRYDYVCPYILWDGVKDRFPNLSYNLFEKSGHTPMLEEKDLFDRKLVDWIKG